MQLMSVPNVFKDSYNAAISFVSFLFENPPNNNVYIYSAIHRTSLRLTSRDLLHSMDDYKRV